MEFRPFDKIARLRRECVITEKIDGTNAQVVIAPGYEVPSSQQDGVSVDDPRVIARSKDGALVMLAGSRTRFVTPTDDNMGFARWVAEHSDELWTLGEGQHFGEWWGQKIQRTYGLTEKRFSLFNVARWNDLNPNRPACCGVVPTLYIGQFNTDAASTQLERLRTLGSVAAPGFMQPEGIVIYLSAARCYFKQTLDQDDAPKSAQQES